MGLRRPLAVLVALVVGVGPACAGTGDEGSEAIDDRLESLAGAGVFIGGVALTNTLVAIHFEGQDRPSPGMRVYVADGAPDGTAEWFEGRADGSRFRFTSTSGRATIEGRIQSLATDGTVTLPDGTRRVFFTRPAGHGAGIFDVAVDGAGAWTGTSLDGSTLEADQTGSIVEGFVRAASGDIYRFRQNDLTRRLGYGRPGGEPDAYTIIITRQATEMVGRGGAVREGRPSPNIVALDLAVSDPPTPGVYYGRVAMTTDKLAVDVDDLGDGRRRVRAYVSDAEPEPEGDIEWFSAQVSGDTFAIISAGGNARLEGTIGPEGVDGSLTLPAQPARRFFAGPAGEGAGVYDVTVEDNRDHVGTSEEGGRLQLTYRDGMVNGRVTAPDGTAVDLLGADLTHAYKLGVEGSLPGTYVAFAAPRGRFLIGRSGDVRAGRPGVNIIGLDKKC